MQTFNKISVIVPAHNEESSILTYIREIKKTMEKNGKDYEIAVVDDGSTDSTYLKVKQSFKHDNNIKISSHNPKQGKGYAIREGFNLCSGDLIAFIDADMDLHPSHLILLEDCLDLKNADVVIGSKRHLDSVLYYPWIRKLYSNVYYLLVKILFGLPVKDTQTGVKIFKREAIQGVEPYLEVNHYAFDLELLVLLHRAGYKIVEAPIRLSFSRLYTGRIGLKDIWAALRDTFSIFRRIKAFRANVKEQN